jgi:adenosylcobinamide kinase / adenosylcobinamide-phosphate guanylyltransferase
MTRRLILILGGARSGKSTHAEKLARDYQRPVLYVATAQAGDEEMAARIARHRTQRPTQWITLEAPRAIGIAIRASGVSAPVVLIDCLTLLANNIIMPLPEPIDDREAEKLLNVEIDDLLATYAASNAVWIIVSNEVGLGLVPPYPLGRIYRDVLGKANQRLAAVADEVLFMVAGLPLKAK